MKKNVTIVIGTQYGDEGKGKFIDLISARASMVFRVQGGNNAGHTVWIKEKKFVTHLIPSAIFRQKCTVALGAGMVIDPLALQKELDSLAAAGINIPPQRLAIDPRAHLILPYHCFIDSQRETNSKQSGENIGTTGRGIGPSYASKAFRESPRIGDFIAPNGLDWYLNKYPHLQQGLTDDVKTSLNKIAKNIAPFVRDVSLMANDGIDAGKKIVIEGAQGSMLDISMGTYPFVTSSNLTAGACAAYLGIPPWSVNNVIGVTKAYATRVGNGPFMGELSGTLEHFLRDKGKEYGSTTGRPRRVGWLDLVALKYFARINGLTSIALMKSDVLTGLDSVGIVVAYRNNITKAYCKAWPTTEMEWKNIEPVIEFLPGWSEIITKRDSLNKEFNNFLKYITKIVKVPIAYISTGADRNSGVWLV